MPLLGFIKSNAEKIEIGLKDRYHPKAKRQTIRACRKDGKNFRKGDKLYLYTGLRTKGCRKLGEVVCTESIPVKMDILGDDKMENLIIHLQSIRLSYSQIETLALNDGFEDVEQFIEFFRYRMPFHGYLIKW